MSHAEAIPWEPILACCATDRGGVSPSPPRVLSELRTGASRLVFFETGSRGDATAYAVKLPRTNVGAIGWDARREYDALVAMQRFTNGANWMVVPPVGVSTDPPFMVTRRVTGSPLRTTAERGMRRWARPGAFHQSLTWCERLGACRRDLRAGATDAAPAEALSADAMVSFCHARLDELVRDRGGSDVQRLRTECGAWIDHAVAGTWSAIGDRFRQRYPCHGDFSFQNVLVAHGKPMCLVDLEGFKSVPVDIDYAKFRFRFEHQRLHPGYSPTRLTRCWERFHRTVCVDPAEAPYFLLSYLHTLLALLAWAARFRDDTTRGNWRIRTRSRLWERQRLHWLARVDRHMSVEHMVQRLTLEL